LWFGRRLRPGRRAPRANRSIRHTVALGCLASWEARMLPDMPAPAIAMRRGGGGGGVGGGGVVVICSLRTRRTATASSLRGRTGGTRAGGREWDFASLRLHGVDRSFPLIFPPIRPPRIGGTQMILWKKNRTRVSSTSFHHATSSAKAVIIREIKIWIAFHREPTIEISLRAIRPAIRPKNSDLLVGQTLGSK